jgi:hypothetical protein
VAGGALLGALVATGTRKLDLARAVAHQTAVALKKVELIEHLRERNAIGDFFELVAAGAAPAEAEAHAATHGVYTSVAQIVFAASPATDAFERALARGLPGALVARAGDETRALVPLPPGGQRRIREALGRARPDGVVVGFSNPCAGLDALAAGFAEAADALAAAPLFGAVASYDELGAYRYLLRIAAGGCLRDRHRAAVARLAEYDAAHSSELVRTLEEFLARQGAIAATAEALYVHQNTLRQRLRRISQLTGVDLRREDWLSLEIAVKLETLDRMRRDRLPRASH